MTRRSITIPVPAPERWLTTNDRSHWAARHRATKAWRTAAGWRARQQRLGCVLSPYAVHAVVHKPTRRLYDVDGITPSVKACLDGFRDAGLVADDDWRHMASITVAAGDPGPACLVITLTELNP